MSPSDNTRGSQKVEPRRKRKRSSGERTARARHVVGLIEKTTAERREVLGDAHPNLTERLAHDLASLHGAKRAMRREIYGERPDLEGKPFNRHRPGGS